MSEKSEDEETNRVLEYYKKYSRNPDLSKYFTGPEADFKKSSTSKNSYEKPTITHVQVETIINVETPTICNVENKETSPASSVASNKKLEWDNGADIGYSNSYKLANKKSASFPSIFTQNPNEEKSISENIQDLRNMYHQLTFSSETSCSPPKETQISSSSSSPSPPPKPSTSSESSSQPQKISSSSDSSNQIPYLQQKIGIPVANSTPYEEASKSSENDVYRETPLLKAQSKPKRTLNVDSKNSSQKSDKSSQREKFAQKLRVQKEVNLCLTKPVSLECISGENKNRVNKLSQTSFSSDLSSKCIQTELEESRRIIRPEIIDICSPQTVKIEFVKYKNETSNSDSSRKSQKIEEPKETKDASVKESVGSNSSKSSEKHEIQVEKIAKSERNPRSNSSKSSTESKKRETKSSTLEKTKESVENTPSFTNSDHFDKYKKMENKSSQSTSASSSVFQSSNSKNSAEKSKIPDQNQKPTSSEEMILSEMISLNHSRDLNTDIKRSIDILQKLLKSKKYDRATKKYYIKKIVQKIVESKYSDDSTTSSELFRPKKSQINQKTASDDVKLMDNKPWYPAEQPVYNTQKSRKIECKTTRTEVFKNLPSTSRKVTKDDHDLTKFERNFEKKKESSPEIQSSDGFVYEKYYEPKISNGENRRDYEATKSNDKNWRNGKTLTEMLIERGKNSAKIGQGDYLLHVAKTERQHQISWINNEIEHLVNLKKLLEKKAKPDVQLNDVISSLLKMKVKDMKAPPSPFEDPRNQFKKPEEMPLDEVPSLERMSGSSNSNEQPQEKENTYGTYGQSKVQVFMYPSKGDDPIEAPPPPKPKSCLCTTDTCKCSQTATHEEKKIQCPAFKPCVCQTDGKEDAKVQCSCKAETGVTSCQCNEESKCKCKEETICQCNQSESATSTSSSDTFMSCICCKKQTILKNLLDRIPLCDPCQQVNKTCFYPYNYSDPLHSCLCYSLIDKGTLYELKNTLTELERLDIYQQYCEILKNCKCCKKCGCQCKLPKRFKNGCAYFLKLEDACPNTRCEEEDYGEYGEGEEEEEVNYLPEVTVKVPNCKAPCARKPKKKSSENFMTCPSIQSYLCTMKPNFVQRAEKRRNILRNAAMQREQNIDDRKLKFIDKVKYLEQKFPNQANAPYGGQTKTYCVYDIKLDDEPKKSRPHVFGSFKEMKELTRRRYLHLNEVKSKKNINREKRLREANRILANTFTRRLQRSTLRGNVNIPQSVKVVTY